MSFLCCKKYLNGKSDNTAGCLSHSELTDANKEVVIIHHAVLFLAAETEE